MAEQLYYLTESDRRRLNEVWSLLGSLRGNNPRPHVPDDLGSTPDTYIALTPPDGIPALFESSVADFTGTGTGLEQGDFPGSADCIIYRILPGKTPLTSRLEQLQFTRKVWNFGETGILGSKLIAVTRDKFGSWLALPREDSFLACLTAKCYPTQVGGPIDTAAERCNLPMGLAGCPDRFIAYSWIRVQDPDSVDTECLRVYNQVPGECGGPGCFPAYSTRNYDYPCYYPEMHEPCCGDIGHGTGTGSDVPHGFAVFPPPPESVVRLRRGQGFFHVFDEAPWSDTFRWTDAYDQWGEIGFHRCWDQNSRGWKDGREVRRREVK